MTEENQPQQQPGQPVIRSTPYASPMHNFGGSILLLTNPENELTKMELTFRSMRVDAKGNTQVVGDPLMNELGINSVIGQVQSIVSQVTVMSNLNKNEIPMLTDFLGDTLAKDLMLNRVNYEIKTPAARDRIYFTALATAFICMKRAYEEGDKRFWKGSQQEITTRIEGAKQPSMIGKLAGWGNK